MMRAAMSLGLSGVGVAGIIFSATMENPLQQPLGPGYVPLCVSVFMTALCMRETFLALRDFRVKAPSGAMGEETKDDKDSVKGGSQRYRWLIAAVLVAASLLIWRFGGYLLGMVASILAVICLDKKIKYFVALPYALLLALSLWFLFKVVLKIDLG